MGLYAHLDLLNLAFETTYVGIALRRGLVQLHDVNHGVRVVLKYTDDRLGLMME